MELWIYFYIGLKLFFRSRSESWNLNKYVRNVDKYFELKGYKSYKVK